MKEITVRIKGKPNYKTEVISENSKYATLSHKDKDGTVVVEHSDGKITRLTLP